MKVKLLDCTLRDGGYVNKFSFENNHMSKIISHLNYSNIDIVECGFLDKNIDQESNTSRFKNINILNDILKNTNIKKSLNVAMIEYGNFNTEALTQVNEDEKNEIKGIRYSFRKSDHLKIFDDVKNIIKKGYKLFIQPIATELYTDLEIINFINECNKYDIYAFYVVDTHGSMLRDNFRRLYYLIDNNLKNGVKQGFHSHNNLQMSYSNAIDFIDISSKNNREIIIDCSIYGMGRGAGNLNTELLADYLNKNYKAIYDIDYLLEIVDDYLLAIKKENEWGYSLEHFLSATHNCHPNYASYLINTKNLSIVEIKKLIDIIPNELRREYSKKTIEEIYINHKKNVSLKIKNLPEEFFQKNILMLASGSSMKRNTSKIIDEIKLKSLTTVSLNHVDKFIKSKYVFFSNQARYNEFSSEITNEEIIVTSHIKVKSNHNNCYVLNFEELFNFENLNVDNVSILFLNLLVKNKVENVFIAGLDGYNLNVDENYSYHEYNRVVDKEALEKINNNLINSIKLLSNKIHITYLTTSLFKQYSKQKVIGVIPSRYSSTRLPGKPLKDIAGLPMVVHVLKRAMMSEMLDEVYVATDDKRIFDIVENFGGNAIMTDESHNNGSERMYEVSQKVFGDIFVVINGDEALLKPHHIDAGVKGLLSSGAPVSLLYNDFNKKNSPSDFKVVLNKKEEIMYISRSDIPSDSRMEVDNMYKAYHVMSFTKEFLDIYNTLEQTPLDKIESHELLRVLENGYNIQAVKVESSAISVDTLADLEFVRDEMQSDQLFSEYKDSIND
jgi:3-deoxy-D-manno-octulosonate cytidylyltransferase